MPDTTPSRLRKIGVFLLVLVLGFAAFAAPALYFQLGQGGGYAGHNFAIIGVVQVLLVVPLVLLGLRLIDYRPEQIGLTLRYWPRDAMLGALVGLAWVAVQFGWLFDATGGAARDDVAGVLAMVDGNWMNVLWYLPLGLLGGAVAEEIYNRGFVITVLEDILGQSTAATVAAALFAILFFAAGHLPGSAIGWVDILIPTTAYTLLFLHTRRLIAPMVAHGVWNASAVIGIQLVYG